jgi:hypothetical protein
MSVLENGGSKAFGGRSFDSREYIGNVFWPSVVESEIYPVRLWYLRASQLLEQEDDGICGKMYNPPFPRRIW